MALYLLFFFEEIISITCNPPKTNLLFLARRQTNSTFSRMSSDSIPISSITSVCAYKYQNNYFHSRQIVLALKKEKSVAITSTTGVASYQLGFGATTLHHWSGIRDGRLTSFAVITHKVVRSYSNNTTHVNN
jgi:hypothetical protein